MKGKYEGRTKFATVGKSYRRLDGIAKVTGKAQFAADMKLPNILYCKILRSTTPHAVLRSIDVSPALAMSEVVAVYTADDIPGENRIGIIVKDEPVLVKDHIRKIGEALAVVVASTEEAAEKALPLIKVDYEEIPAVFSPEEAMAIGAPLIHEESKDNIQSVIKIKRGNVEEAIARSKVVISRRYTTQMIEHAYVEPEAGIAVMEDNCVKIWASTQNPHYDRREVARVLGIGQHQVRVIQATTGGGFGGKLDISVQCFLGLAAYKTGQPVRMVYDREESFMASPKRHPFIIDYTSACDEEGRLLAVKVKIVGDTGAYASYGPATLKRAAVHATGPYEVPNVSIESFCVYTNNPTAGAMRGFGTPQMAFAHESQMDLLAEALGMDKFTIRLRNCFHSGSLTATGQRLSKSVGIRESIVIARNKARELGMLNSHLKNHGVGIGCMWYGIGNTGAPNPAGAFLDFNEDGTAIVLTGCADIGQGSTTALAQIAAEELGIEISNIYILAGDTGISPDAGASSASRQTYISGNAVRLAAQEAKETILKEASNVLGVDRSGLDIKDGYIVQAGEKTSLTLKDLLKRCRLKGQLTLGSGRFNPHTTEMDENGQGVPYATYSFATQVTEVEVDSETGKVKVLRVIAAHDVGKAINPQAVEGQIEGGILMGIGYALMEEVKLSEGKIVNPRLSEYFLPMSLDTPQIYSFIIEKPEKTGPFGAKGVGEPALVPTAASIANAVANALNTRFYDLPITLEKVVLSLPSKGD